MTEEGFTPGSSYDDSFGEHVRCYYRSRAFHVNYRPLF